ncbi:hypothetical protein GCM10025792_49310 [Pseudonocardia tropica]
MFATARIVLSAYGTETVSRRSERQNFDADRFVRSRDTVYITAPSHLQSITAPLVVGLLEEIRQAAYRWAREQARTHRQAPPVLWALDEVANIAPIGKLPDIVSEAGSQGLQVMACFQDLSQAGKRWNKEADGFLTLFGTKVVFPGIGDPRTLQALSLMAGDWDRPYTVFNTSTGRSMQFGFPLGMGVGSNSGTGYQFSTQREARLTPSEISTIPPGHALLVRVGRCGLVETTHSHSWEPWQRVLAAGPPTVLDHGPHDDLSPGLPVAEVEPVRRQRRSPYMRPQNGE